MITTSQKASYKGREIITTLQMTDNGDWLPNATIDGAPCKMFKIPHKEKQDAYGRAFRTARDFIDNAGYR